MKVLFFVTTLGAGGAEKVLVDIVNNLDKAKYDITVYSLFNEGIYIKSLDSHIKYKYFFNNINNNKNTIKIKKWLIFKIIKNLSAKLLYNLIIHDTYDVEIAFLEGIGTKVISGSNNSKKLAWIHADLIKFPWSTEAYINLNQEIKSYKKFSKILCVSDSVKESFKEKFKINAEVQYNVLNDKDIIRKSNEEIYDIDESNKLRLISVGRLTGQKSFDRLLRVHKRLINEGCDHELIILGEGEDRTNLENIISVNALGNSVKLLGFKENPYKYMRTSDIFVISSLSEGFSTVATEAIILGMPLVTTDCAGMKDLLGDSEYGLITDNSENGLYCGLKQLLTSEELLRKYQAKANERKKDFILEKRVAEYEALLDSI